MTTRHSITWWVYAGTELIRRQRTMRGNWGYEAKCSCGWETHTGGATKASVKRDVAAHKLDASIPEPTEAEVLAYIRKVLS